MSFSKTWSYVRKHSKDLSLFGKLMAGNQILLVQTGNTPIQLRSSTLGKHWGQSELLKVWLFVDHRTKASLGGFPRVYQPAMLGYTEGYVFQTLSRTNVWKWSFSMTKHTILISRWCNPHVLLDDDSLLHLYYYLVKKSQHLLSIKSFVCGFLLPKSYPKMWFSNRCTRSWPELQHGLSYYMSVSPL